MPTEPLTHAEIMTALATLRDQCRAQSERIRAFLEEVGLVERRAKEDPSVN